MLLSNPTTLLTTARSQFNSASYDESSSQTSKDLKNSVNSSSSSVSECSSGSPSRPLSSCSPLSSMESSYSNGNTQANLQNKASIIPHGSRYHPYYNSRNINHIQNDKMNNISSVSFPNETILANHYEYKQDYQYEYNYTQAHQNAFLTNHGYDLTVHQSTNLNQYQNSEILGTNYYSTFSKIPNENITIADTSQYSYVPNDGPNKRQYSEYEPEYYNNYDIDNSTSSCPSPSTSASVSPNISLSSSIGSSLKHECLDKKEKSSKKSIKVCIYHSLDL